MQTQKNKQISLIYSINPPVRFTVTKQGVQFISTYEQDLINEKQIKPKSEKQQKYWDIIHKRLFNEDVLRKVKSADTSFTRPQSAFVGSSKLSKFKSISTRPISPTQQKLQEEEKAKKLESTLLKPVQWIKRRIHPQKVHIEERQCQSLQQKDLQMIKSIDREKKVKKYQNKKKVRDNLIVKMKKLHSEIIEFELLEKLEQVKQELKIQTSSSKQLLSEEAN